MQAILKREFRSYFTSMTGYVFLACVLFFVGVYFMSFNLNNGYPFFAYALVGGVNTVFMFMVPILTMKSFAEERKAKTDQILLTAPVSVKGIVMGKYLSMMGVVGLSLVVCCFCPLIISGTHNWYPATDYATIFAYLCMMSLYVSVGMFISSTTDNQIIAAVLTFLALLLLRFWDTLIGYIPTTEMASAIGFGVMAVLVGFLSFAVSRNQVLGVGVAVGGIAVDTVWYFLNPSAFEGLITKVLKIFSCGDVMQNFAYSSVFDFGGIFYYLSVSALFIFLTCQMIQKRRWN